MTIRIMREVKMPVFIDPPAVYPAQAILDVEGKFYVAGKILEKGEQRNLYLNRGLWVEAGAFYFDSKEEAQEALAKALSNPDSPVLIAGVLIANIEAESITAREKKA